MGEYEQSPLALVLAINKKGKGNEPVPTATDLMGNIDFEKVKCKLYVPRFKYEFGIELKDVLESMGVKEAFSQDADFSAMNGKKDLQIGAVIHKAVIEVNELGTEAAAATVVVMRAKKGKAKRKSPPTI